jgi:hypothetical protein
MHWREVKMILRLRFAELLHWRALVLDSGYDYGGFRSLRIMAGNANRLTL